MIGKVKLLLFSLVTVLGMLFIIETTCLVVVLLRNDGTEVLSKHTPFVDIKQWQGNRKDLRSKYLEMESDYFVFDPNLGTRFRPNSRVVSLESSEDGTPRIASSRFLLVDRYGYISNSTNTEDAIDYAQIANDPTVYRVLVSGGSTAAGWGASANDKTWPAVLERILNGRVREIETRFTRAVVINAGVLGYNISQEIRSYQEETSYLNPHIVIAFNGINEIWNYHGDPVEYTFRGPQKRLIEQLNYGPPRKTWKILPYFSMAFSTGRKNVRGKPLYGYQTSGYLELAGTDLYLSKIRQFKALCDAAGSEFRYVLQPAMGVGEKVLTARESMHKNFFGSSMYRTTWEEYRSNARSFFADDSKRLTEDWQIDMSHLFDSFSETVYADPRHYNDLGQEAIAGELAEMIVSNRLIEHSRDYAVSKSGPSLDTRTPATTITRGWNFWYELMDVSTSAEDQTFGFSCLRPISAPNGTPWRCTCRTSPGSQPIPVRLDNTKDAEDIGNRLRVAFQKTRRPGQEFESATDVIFRACRLEECKSFRCSKDATLSPHPSGFELRSTGESPMVFLPTFSWEKGTFPILKVEISSPQPSFFEVFFLSEGQENYTAKQRMYQGLDKGKNTLYFPLPEADSESPLRLDPGNTAAVYVIHGIEARGVARD